jgi:hypothetical protein
VLVKTPDVAKHFVADQIYFHQVLVGTHGLHGLGIGEKIHAMAVVLIASQITTDEQGFDFPQEVDFAPIYKSCSVTDENSFYWM